jgi:hypothetical protein
MPVEIVRPYRFHWKDGRKKGEALYWAETVGEAFDKFRKVYPLPVRVLKIEVRIEGEWIREV